VLIRQNAPVFGASGKVLPDKGELQIDLAFRGLHSDDHYNGTVYQSHRKELGNYVVNNQRILDLSATYSLTRRLALSASVPYVDASWSIPSPVNPPGERREQNASGIGDVVLSGRFWLMNPDKHPSANISVGLGCKVPTGDYDQKDRYPDLRTGLNTSNKVVDQSIQPGDGGWGITFEVQGYRAWRHVTLFGSGNYLANPRDTNGADSIIVGAGLGANPTFSEVLVNSVPDSYLLRLGTAFPIKGGLSLSAAFRMEGLPRYDLIGDSHGWRRPGYETFFEPGIVYTRGASTWSLHVPIAIVRNRQVAPYSGFPGDATFPDLIVLAGYSHRFAPGGRHAPPPAGGVSP